VPRPESWPERRTGTPSSSSVPQASDSAVAQSTSPRPSASSARRLTKGSSLGWISKPSGSVPSAFSTVRSRARMAAGSTSANARGWRRSTASKGAAGATPSDDISAFFSAQSLSSSSRVTTPSRTSLAPYSEAAEGWVLIFAYINGWV